MNLQTIKEIIRAWAPLVGIAFAGYYAYDFYVVFQQDDASPIKVKAQEIASIKAQNEKLKNKVKELEEFSRRLEVKKQEVSAIAQQLSETRGALADDVQMPIFMKLLVSEAKRVGLTVLSVTPAKKITRDFYSEHPVDVKFRGVYAQAFSFIDRLANLTRITRVEQFRMKPISSASAKYVEIEGSLEVKTFSYLGSQADSIGKESK